MTVDDVWAQLEADLAWRQDELRLLANSAVKSKDADRDRLRRAQLVMLYAHVEGFCKIALLTYIKAVNDLKLSCADANEYLAAAAFDDVFHALAYGDQKGRVFHYPLPADEKLRVFARHRDFMAELANLLHRPLSVPEDVVNTESNLNAIVLRRNLFRLGFPAHLLAAHEVQLDELVNRRNNIAHGLDSSIVRQTDYDRLQRTVFQVMDELALLIVGAVEKSAPKRATPLFNTQHPNPTLDLSRVPYE